MLDQIEAFFALKDRFFKSLSERKEKRVESIATRFVRLFESHGVHRNQIPGFFGHGLAIADVQSDLLILAKLDEHSLKDACELFGVRREWLDGADSEIYKQRRFYKKPQDFIEFIAALKANNPNGQFDGRVIASDVDGGDNEAILIIRESVGFIEDRTIYRAHFCDTWVFDYWRSRVYLTACVAIAWKNRIYIDGVYIPKKYVEQIARGRLLLISEGDYVFAGKAGARWFPEDMALYPKAFIHRLDPERNNFGIKAGLNKWLELNERGFMNTGINCVMEYHKSFSLELEKIKTS